MDVTQHLGTEERPVRIAIIGAGPAAFYAVEALLKHRDRVCQIDMFNRLPTPFGLVRDGVAPDHQSIKGATRIYDRIAQNPNVRYFGNVTFGTHISHEDLKPLYDQIVYAVGSQADRRMGIPGEDLYGSYPATEFVGWYNGHPDYCRMQFDLSHERAVVVGNGNVAMDVARILLTDPDELARTDIADYALAALRESCVREVIMLGRRGPAQAAFTNPEIKEFGNLAGVDALVDPADLELDEQSAASLADNKVAAKNVEILQGFAARGRTGADRAIFMRFLVSPVELIGQDNRVVAVKVERNKLQGDRVGGLRACGTGQFEIIEAGLVLRSVGYRGVPLSGVPFDDSTYTIPNVAGRVVLESTGEPLPGEYVVGWIKRGPSGVIGTNKPDSVSTVAAMVEDWETLPGIADENRDRSNIEALLKERKPDYVTYADWQVLDRYEVACGAECDRPRVKVTNLPAMLDVMRRG
ncbi:MAG TPA: FAD-dependent oxidoreductase [Roseiflexaceae bacterium]|jgi:ferredoxin--NADP+ reductase|nr:FAD-dependent oxidoreductase [Roseiflexaceae bacterium]